MWRAELCLTGDRVVTLEEVEIVAVVVSDPGFKTVLRIREHLGTVGLSGHHPSLEHPACSFQPEATATTREEF